MLLLQFIYVLLQIEIHAPPGVPVGYVSQTWHPCLPEFSVQNERREEVLKISGPCVVCSCCADVDFEVRDVIVLVGFAFLM